jgi:hypothetical protein
MVPSYPRVCGTHTPDIPINTPSSIIHHHNIFINIHNFFIIHIFLHNFAMASSSTTLKFFFVFVVFAAMTSAQDLGLSPASSPAPSPDAGAAGFVTNSMAMIGVSIVLSMLAILKH